MDPLIGQLLTPKYALGTVVLSYVISFFGSLFVQLRGGRFCFWVMDLNPDQMIALGLITARSLRARDPPSGRTPRPGESCRCRRRRIPGGIVGDRAVP